MINRLKTQLLLDFYGKCSISAAIMEKKLPSTAWKKGQSGNPKGRPPKGNTIADCMNAYLEQIGEDGLTKKEAFVRAVYKSAMEKNPAAQKLIWDHIDGTKQQITSEISVTQDALARLGTIIGEPDED